MSDKKVDIQMTSSEKRDLIVIQISSNESITNVEMKLLLENLRKEFEVAE